MSAQDKLVFVVHQHAATSLHYDFRLQVGKVMPSWAIPKGPTLDPTVKRLAMKVDDHSLEYKNFEGIIKEGHYGAGPVIVWDEGSYLPEIEVAKGVRQRIEEVREGNRVMVEGIEKGEIKFFLKGKKLKGSFALVKTKGFPPGTKNAWLLIKHKDEYAKEGYDPKDEPLSVKTGKSIEEIGAE